MDRTRRGLLSTAGVAAAAGLSGCLGLFGGGSGGGDGDGDGDGDGSGETTTTTARPTEESFVRWLPAQEGFQGGRYRVLQYDVTAFRERRSALPSSTFGLVRAEVDRATVPGIDAGAVASVLRFRPRDTRVVTGSFSASEVRQALEDAPYAPLEEGYGDFRIYVSDRASPPAVAVTDGVALLCTETGPNAPVAVARRLIDTERGELPRYQERSDALGATLVPLAGATHVAGGLISPVGDPDPRRGRFEGMTSFAVAFEVGSDRTDLTYAVGFADEVPVGQVRSWASEHSDGLAVYDDVSVVRDGPVARVTGAAPTDRVDFLSPGDPQ